MAAKTAITMSTLNPNAPLFIPASYAAVEDFSPEWWHLVQTCPVFHEYWLRERFESVEETFSLLDDGDEFDALEDLLDFQNLMQLEELQNAEELAHCEQNNGTTRETEKDLLCAFGDLNVNGLRGQHMWHEPLKHHDKISNWAPRSPMKGVNQYRIHQPRA